MEPTNLYLRILLQQKEPCDHDECRKLVAKLKQENTQLRAVIAKSEVMAQVVERLTRLLSAAEADNMAVADALRQERQQIPVMEEKTKQIQMLAWENTQLAQLLSDADADNMDMAAAYVERCGQLEVYKRKSEDLKKKCDHLRHALDGVSLVV